MALAGTAAGDGGSPVLKGLARILLAGMAGMAVLGGCRDAAPVSPPGMLAYEVSLASGPERLAVAWHGGDGRAHDAIWLRALDLHGRPRDAAHAVSDRSHDAYEPDLQWLDDDLVVAWYEKDAQGDLAAFIGRFDTHGKPRWLQQLSAPGRNGRNPVVRVAGGQLHLAWLEAEGHAAPQIIIAALAADGHPLRPAHAAAAASTDTWNLNAAVDAAGHFFVAYDAHVGTRAKELHLLQVTGQDASDLALGADDGFDSAYPDIAFSEAGRLALSWSDRRDGNEQIYLFVGTAAELGTSFASHTRRITTTPGSSIGAYLAWNGAWLALAWCDDSAGQYEIHAQVFDRDGRPVAPSARLTHNATDSLIPAVRPLGRGFALAWTERRAAPGDGAGHSTTLASTAVLRLVDAIAPH